MTQNYYTYNNSSRDISSPVVSLSYQDKSNERSITVSNLNKLIEYFLPVRANLPESQVFNVSVRQFNQIQYDQKHFIQISKSKYFLLQDSRKKKVNRQRAALGFPPSHEVLQELSGVEHCRPLSDQDKETKSHERST